MKYKSIELRTAEGSSFLFRGSYHYTLPAANRIVEFERFPAEYLTHNNPMLPQVIPHTLSALSLSLPAVEISELVLTLEELGEDIGFAVYLHANPHVGSCQVYSSERNKECLGANRARNEWIARQKFAAISGFLRSGNAAVHVFPDEHLGLADRILDLEEEVDFSLPLRPSRPIY